jgi:signal transduction histidine kinase
MMVQLELDDRASRAATRERVAPTAPVGRDRFVAYVAHELRGPIALQRTLVDVALADPEANVQTLREMGQRVIAALEHQQRLIDGLLELTRAERGLSSREPVDLALITTAALRTHDLGSIASAALLEPARATGDACLLAQLTANLISNAIRHNIPRGLVTVATGTVEKRPFLSVANTGRTVPPPELERLFEPFQRLAPGPPARPPGLGLGLAIVRAIADAHNALITVRPGSSGGLAVRVSFPAELSPPPVA